ncbi:hypothetical protein R5R35_013528 [Gryllus longicercus]|uniref:EGF-like domain-containing protein n=1 Tax=Gryllus longicercus TaxID=2509291 RepID=A0AAN9YT20_9ORTH
MLMSLRVDRLYERRVVWSSDLQDPSSEMYQQLQWEASRAVDSAMSMTPFSDDFLGARVNGVYAAPGTAAPVFVNLTLQLEETAETLRPAVRHDVQRHLLGVIHRRANNVGESALWVDAPAGAVSHLQDVDECARPELHDCHPRAVCSNVFGGFRCACAEGLRDPWADQPARAGRACEPCPPEHCGGPARGACHYDAQGQPVCTCTGNFYGAQCEVDGEVLGVAVGASVAAVVIIALTLVCLCMWSRRWQREQKAAVGSPVFGYLGAAGGTVKTPAVGGPPYQVSLEDRLRWAQIADVMAQANHYSTPLACQQPEPGGTVPTRPSSAVFGYPALPAALTATLPPAPLPRLGLHGLLPPPPAPQGAPPPPPAPSTRAGSGARTIDNCSSGDDEDRADLLGGRSFHVPRPKSRSSVANQSGIYYDVDYDQSDIYGTKHPSIPMNTYASRGSYHRQ